MKAIFRQLICGLVLLLSLWPGHLLAHGGGTPRLTDAAVGPYRLFVWSQPDTPRVGEMHFTVAVVAADGDANAADSGDTLDTPVLDATVQLQLRAADDPEQMLVSAATRDQALFPQYYETDFDLPKAGAWRASVTVNGPAGAGDATFDFEVLPPRQLNWTMVAGGFLLLLLLSLAGRPGGGLRPLG
ncbi:MAG: hypothetical protein DYG89_11615 [Caldilinea sp. CFX5]|nr:hypothetical protein [Caldilinea sp. CFX5]